MPPQALLVRLFKTPHLKDEKERVNSEKAHWGFVGTPKRPPAMPCELQYCARLNTENIFFRMWGL